jgi:GT2 family glycosyltransferase
LHDESFNSSEIKEKDVTTQKIMEEEYTACNQSNPVAGYRWCTIEDVVKNKPVYALPQIYLYRNIIVKFNNINPIKSIIFIDDLLNITTHLEIETKIWVYSFCDFNLDNLHDIHSLIKNYVEYLQNPRLTCIECYGECSQHSYYKLKLKAQDDWDNLLTNIQDNTESEDQTTVTELLIDYDCEINPDITSFMGREWNQSWLNQIAYTDPNLYKSYEIYNKIRETELNYKNSDKHRQLSSLQTRRNSNNNQALISIVTSVYQGKEFIQGFLENITKQTIFSQCELILIDGNSPENEGEIIEAFIRQNGFSNIHYHRLNEDPGLYECWNIAIRQSRGQYITNANLDDRRSPLHLEILANHLENNPQISAVSSALVVTYQPNEDWNFFTPEAVWFDGLSGEITFDDLYKYNDDIVVSRNTLHCMPLWKKDLHNKYGYFDESNYGTTADWEFWLRCSSQGEKYGIIGLPLGLYYLNPNSHNRRNDADGSLELRIINKYFSVNQEKVIKQ